MTKQGEALKEGIRLWLENQAKLKEEAEKAKLALEKSASKEKQEEKQ